MLRKPLTRLDVLDQEEIKEYEQRRQQKYGTETAENMKNLQPSGGSALSIEHRIGLPKKHVTNKPTS